MLASKSIRRLWRWMCLPAFMMGIVMGIALRADLTVTFGWEKNQDSPVSGPGVRGRQRWLISDFPDRPWEAVKEAEGTAAGDFAVTYPAMMI